MGKVRGREWRWWEGELRRWEWMRCEGGSEEKL